MTAEQSREITACTNLIALGYTAQALRDLGYAEAAILSLIHISEPTRPY